MRDQWRRSDEPQQKSPKKKFAKEKFDRYQELEGEIFSPRSRTKHRNRREQINTLRLLELAETND